MYPMGILLWCHKNISIDKHFIGIRLSSTEIDTKEKYWRVSQWKLQYFILSTSKYFGLVREFFSTYLIIKSNSDKYFRLLLFYRSLMIWFFSVFRWVKIRFSLEFYSNNMHEDDVIISCSVISIELISSNITCVFYPYMTLCLEKTKNCTKLITFKMIGV